MMPRSKKPNKKKSQALVPRGVSALTKKRILRVSQLLDGSTSENTRQAYEKDLADWETFAKAERKKVYPISEQALIEYIVHLDEERGLKLTTIRRRLSAISQWHKAGDLDSPTETRRVRRLLKGLAREKGNNPTKKRALTAVMIREVIADYLDAETKEGLRDRTLLLVGFITGMRRSELVAFRWEHVSREPEGLVILIPFSKANQEGEPEYVGLPFVEGGGDARFSPAQALLDWQVFWATSEGPVFDVSVRTVNRIVKRHVKTIGYDPVEFGAHSFRSGYVTEANRAGASLSEIMTQSRHKTLSVAQGYIQKTEALENKATRGVLDRLQGK